MTESVAFAKNLKVGISIGDTLDAWNDTIDVSKDPLATETCWKNPKITKELIQAILKEGFGVIRIPVTWRTHIGPAPSFTIQKEYLDRVNEVVDYVYEQGAYVILNIHHEDWNDPYYTNEQPACAKMKAVWAQLADRFKDYDNHLIFEGQNEPRKIGTDVEWNGGDKEGWDVVNAMNKAFYDTVRSGESYNKERFLMLPGYGANCTVGILHIDLPDDPHVLVSVHAYEPWDFCLNTKGRSTWKHDTTVIDKVMSTLNELYISKGIGVVIGEFGAMSKLTGTVENEAERVEWVTYYTDEAKKINVPCVWWDNALFTGDGERFGLFNRYENTVAFPGIVRALTR